MNSELTSYINLQTRELIKDLEMRLNNFNIQKHRTTPNYKKKYKPDQERLLLKVLFCGVINIHQRWSFGKVLFIEYLVVKT